MKIDATHFGPWPLTVVRKFLKATTYDTFAADWARDWARKRHADIPADLVDTLIEHGLAEKNREGDIDITAQGRSIRGIKLVPRMNRATINKLVTDVEKRVREVNADDRFVKRFEMLGLFGSVLNEDAIDFGDLDVVFRLGYKERWESLCQANIAAKRSGFADQVSEFHLTHFPADGRRSMIGAFEGMDNRPLQYVKSRRTRIAFHDESDLASLEMDGPVPYRLLFGERTPQ